MIDKGHYPPFNSSPNGAGALCPCELWWLYGIFALHCFVAS